MALAQAMGEAFNTLLANFQWAVLGTLVGMFLALIPGLGGSAALALLIPFTLGWEPEPAFILFGAALGATSFAGSITAILVNTPGTAGNAATLLDGYPLTRQGKGKVAIGAAAAASALGAMIGLGVFVLTIPILREISLLFATIEILWLAVFGIVIIPVAVPGPLIKGMIGGGLGLLFAYHGYATFSGEFRFFYILDLTPKGDLPLVPVIIGLFAIAEMLNLASKNESLSPEQESGPLGGKLREGLVAPLKNKAVTIRSAIIGTLVGVVPGIGASVANLLAYSHIAQLEKGDPPFGEGNIRGVVASEAANDSKDGGQLIPTLGLGIPGSGSTAVLLGAFIIHGIVPGPTLMTEHLSLVLVIFFALLTSNLLTSILGSLLANYLVYVTKIEIPYLYPSIIGLTIMATYVTDSSFGDVSVAVLFGLIGFAFISLNITRIPIIISLVLGSIIEVNFYNALKLGEVPWIFFQSTVSKILAGLLFVTILYALINWINDVKELNLLDR